MTWLTRAAGSLIGCSCYGRPVVAEVTVISPNIVELVGNLQQQFGVNRTERPPPRPPVQAQSGDTTENRGGQRALAGGQTFAPALTRSRPDSGEDPTPRRNPFRADITANRPSTPFLTQLIGQQNAATAVATKRLEAGIAAYQRANGGPARAPSGIAFLTRRVDAFV
jgi:hypothetical protein